MSHWLALVGNPPWGRADPPKIRVVENYKVCGGSFKRGVKISRKFSRIPTLSGSKTPKTETPKFGFWSFEEAKEPHFLLVAHRGSTKSGVDTSKPLEFACKLLAL